MTNNAAICVDGVHKRFGKHQVLQDVSFRVEPGQTFAFLGRNGAGKTTTLRMLLGLLPPDEGSLSVLGLDPATDPLKLRAKVGYLAEDQTMFGWMTVEQVIRFAAPFYETWDHTLAGQYVEQFDLPLRTRIKHLSKGQNVRLGLLLAMAHRPQLVILDDPTLGLDPVMRKEFNRALITHLQGEGRTVLYSSHLLQEVESVADVVAILHEGRIVRQETTETLRSQVKRLLVSIEALGQIHSRLKVLDVQTSDSEAAVTVDEAPAAIELLSQDGIAFQAVDLNLDEIFEAFVAGRTDPHCAEPQASLMTT